MKDSAIYPHGEGREWTPVPSPLLPLLEGGRGPVWSPYGLRAGNNRAMFHMARELLSGDWTAPDRLPS